jgi:hypothetical protein
VPRRLSVQRQMVRGVTTYRKGSLSRPHMRDTGQEPEAERPLVKSLKTACAVRSKCTRHCSMGVKGKPLSWALVRRTSR